MVSATPRLSTGPSNSYGRQRETGQGHTSLPGTDVYGTGFAGPWFHDFVHENRHWVLRRSQIT